MDANYYHYPDRVDRRQARLHDRRRLPDALRRPDGTPIDVCQQNTNMNDEATTAYQLHIDTLLDNAVGPNGYYGAFGMNMHTDDPAPHAGAEDVVAAAQARGVPVISYKQLLDWVDGRDDSTIRGLSWNAGTFTFTTTVGAGANGLQTLLPMQGPSGTLSAISRGGSPVAYTVETIKGIQYAVFDAATRHVRGDVLLEELREAESAPAPLGRRAGAREVDDVVPDGARELGEVGELPAQRLVEPEDRARRRAASRPAASRSVLQRRPALPAGRGRG